MNIWGEIRNDFEMDELIFIDAWETENDNEEGKVIAKVTKDGEVTYLDDRAIKDTYAQEMITDAIKRMIN